MSDIDRYYDILGLRPGASPEEIRQAYRDMAKVWHPDRFLNDPRLQVLAHEKMKVINQAYGGLLAHRPDDDSKPSGSPTSPPQTPPSSQRSAEQTRDRRATPPQPPPGTHGRRSMANWLWIAVEDLGRWYGSVPMSTREKRANPQVVEDLGRWYRSMVGYGLLSLWFELLLFILVTVTLFTVAGTVLSALGL